ncbi:MAG: ABC transporter permease [Cyclobacteriaceae bacterium]|nr:ABC transporter permease [Cyclobacteriaceae bacterium]
MSRTIIGRSPNYYIKKRFFRNKPAVSGLIYICMAIVIALLGYSIMPDKTPDANDGAVQIQKKPAGFSVNFLKIRKNYRVNRKGFINMVFFGQENHYTIIPIETYELKGTDVMYKEYGVRGKERSVPLVQVVYPLFTGKTDSLWSAGNYKISGEQIKYINPDGEIIETTMAETAGIFRSDHIEKRTFWLGTDRSGRDLLSRLLYGTRISLAIGFVAVVISMFLGLSFGAIAGFWGGRIDDVIVWLMSVVWSIPGIMLVIAISLALQSRGIWVAFVAVGFTMWVDVARVVRGQIISIKQKTFIEAARALGMKNFRIIYNHMLPNMMGPLIVIATANFAAAILLEAGLSFLGLSVQPPTPSWGSMIFEGFNVLGTKNSWHLVVFPGLAISLMVLSFNLLGNGVRDAIDPKSMVK